jgi:hypothetical protein
LPGRVNEGRAVIRWQIISVPGRLGKDRAAAVPVLIEALADEDAIIRCQYVPGVAPWTFTNVPIVYANGNAADNDTLTFTGTNNSDTSQINLAAAGTDAGGQLQR